MAVDYQFVSPEYFQLLDIDLIRGRGFTDAERAADAGVTVVSESAARRLWPNGDALGQVVRIQADRPTDLRRPSALTASVPRLHRRRRCTRCAWRH